MIVIAFAILGVVFGLRSARKQGGKPLDLLQYAFIYAIAFGLVGMVLTVLAERLL